MNTVRNLLLAASTNTWLRERATKSSVVRRAVSAFMPGEDLDAAILAARRQESLGVRTMLTNLGENLTRAEEAEAVTEHYLEVLDRVQSEGLQAQISVKPTQLGLDLDPALCARNLQTLLDRAALRNGFVWLDMESSGYVDRTINLFRRAREASPQIGLALQAYLYRTMRDLDVLLPLGATIRLVKGAYLEAASVAFSKKANVDERFYELACRFLDHNAHMPGGLLQIATHDERLIRRLERVIADRGVASSAYEYAMLYGIQRLAQQRLARARQPLRVLISYGDHWFPWYMRRLAERPANLGFVLKSAFR